MTSDLTVPGLLTTPSYMRSFEVYNNTLFHKCNFLFPYTDQLSIRITSPRNPVVSEGGTVTLTAAASGITDKKQLIYLWEKNGKSKLPDKISGYRSTMITIPNIMEADEGQYSCTVTNEWGNNAKSEYVTLTVQGNKTYKMSVCICTVYM